jgi:hypothetical protein
MSSRMNNVNSYKSGIKYVHILHQHQDLSVIRVKDMVSKMYEVKMKINKVLNDSDSLRQTEDLKSVELAKPACPAHTLTFSPFFNNK